MCTLALMQICEALTSFCTTSSIFFTMQLAKNNEDMSSTVINSGSGRHALALV